MENAGYLIAAFGAVWLGIALYVAATDLIPEFNQEGQTVYSLSALGGLVLYFVIHAVSTHFGIR